MQALRSQHDLVDSVWVSLIRTKPMAQFGVDNELGAALLDVYWTWLHPLHNCVYRPGRCEETSILHLYLIS